MNRGGAVLKTKTRKKTNILYFADPGCSFMVGSAGDAISFRNSQYHRILYKFELVYHSKSYKME